MATKATGAVLVVGGGVAGIQASLDLAEAGFQVYLTETRTAIGGVMAQLDKTFPTNDCSMCIISPKLVEAGRHPNIRLLTMTEVTALEGEPGHFTAHLTEFPRYVDLQACTGCGECAKVCPVSMPSRFDAGLRDRRAAYKLYPQAMPGAYAIEKHGTAPCKDACPVHPSIQAMLTLAARGDLAGAYAVFRSAHPFPGICGRVCHHPCESQCTRGKVDQPLAIAAVHRFLADWARENKPAFTPAVKPLVKDKVAVIGAGPAGLTCAEFLAREGYRVTVFEKDADPGGMLIQGIPAFRLPRAIVQEEIAAIKALGVEIRCNTTIGADTTIGRLRDEGYRAFFIGIGAGECKMPQIPGQDLEGVFGGLDFLGRALAGQAMDIGRRVAVIGGGNVAMDAVRTARRLGAAEAMIVYRRSEAEMPAGADEVAECREEGIAIHPLILPEAILGENGRVAVLSCIRMRLGAPDQSGRRRPEPIADSQFILPVDSVIMAIGQESDWACLTEECACTVNDWGTLRVDPFTLQSEDADIFAGGDAVSGPRTVVEAIAAGKQAAVSIDRFLRGEDLYRGREQASHVATVETREVAQQKREAMARRTPEARIQDFDEVHLGLRADQLAREASRCLACGGCCECYRCVDACLAKAVDHEMTATAHHLEVGAVILAPGIAAFDPSVYATYGYGAHPNVVTSLEFERLLSASGPYAGHLVRPSDGRPPTKIAWLQCIGSRDENACDRGYCSSVCCMYANKQAVIAKEHSEKHLDAAIFYMDMRTFGKDFDRYHQRAESEYGVRFIRSRIHSVLPAEDGRLRIVYATDAGKRASEHFDIVVLSVGLQPSAEAIHLARRLDVDLTVEGFARTGSLAPVATSRPGVFVCGAFQEPKDIPQSVMEASAAAAAAGCLLTGARGEQVHVKQLPPERDITGQQPRIGVFVCNCGINIGGVADVPGVREYARGLPYVVHVEDNLFTCSQDTQDKMKEVIQEKGINRVVVASCSPRTHEPLFQETIREAGLNKYLFEMANIRDQDTWVHMNDPVHATAKARDLVRMAVAKAAYVEPLHQVGLDIVKAALVVGGGVAGMEAALGIADQGCRVFLVERAVRLGGVALGLRSAWRGEPVAPYLQDLITRTVSHPHIRVFTETVVTGTGGSVGHFTTRLASISERASATSVIHGVTILATGGRELVPTDHLYGLHPDVLTHLELDAALEVEDPRLAKAGSVLFIQCVGSRTPERPYCSKVCCTHSLKAALALREKNPKARIYIAYRDIRSFGLRESLYREARQKGIIFIRYDLGRPPKVNSGEDRHLAVELQDHVLRTSIRLRPDLIVLASAIVPNDNRTLFEMFKVPVNADGFLIEAHAKLRPVDLSTDGIFMAGLAHWPKALEETIAQARAACARAMTLLSHDRIMVGGVVATVDPGRCAVCLTCVRTCPYGVPRVGEHAHAEIDPALCHGCGSCAAECPGKAIELKHFTDAQLLAKTGALFAEAAA